MQLNSLPIRRHDETLYSIAARMRLVNAARSDYDACQSLFGHSKSRRISEFPVNLMHFCEVTKGQLGNPQDILAEMTLAGFFDRIGSRPWRAGSTSSPMSTAGYGLATLSNGSATIWRACSLCIESDIAQNATAYWRRSHHVPTAFLCPIHDAPLIARVSPIHERHNRFLLPEDTAPDYTFWKVELTRNYETLMRLTKLGIEILEDTGCLIESQTMYATLCSGLRSRGLLTHSGSIRGRLFAGEFSDRYGFLSRHPDFSDAVSSRGSDILQRNLRNTNSVRSAAHNLLLIDWLFGAWGAFKEHCNWQSLMDCHGLETDIRERSTDKSFGVSCDVKQNPFIDRQLHRRVCLNFLELEVSATRSGFSRFSPKSFRWLLCHDIEWLDAQLPFRQRTQKQGELL